MATRLLFTVPTVLLSLILTFAPVFAQDATTATADDARTARSVTDDHNRPDLGWLGLIGLVGLGGLMRRDRDGRRHAERPVHR
jgi:hypothetical protein